MRLMRMTILPLVLVFCSGVALSQEQEVSQAKFVEIANRMIATFDARDSTAYRGLLDEELSKKKLEQEHPGNPLMNLGGDLNELEPVLEMLGKVQKLEFEELDPPDGAFFTIQFEQGKAELLLVLNAEGKITEANLRVIEHPESQEHPEEGEEHPEEGKEHPEEGAKQAEKKNEPPTIESVAKFLEDYAEKKTEAQGGWMKIPDEQAKGDLLLRLDKIHRERLAKTGKGTYFVCADFKTPKGKLYDLDFWVKDSEEGLSVTETTIHKEEGKPRYDWVEKDGIWNRKSR